MLIVPLAWALLLGLTLESREPNAWGYAFGLASGLWLMICVPLVYLIRSHVFRAAWVGRPVEPDSYLRGLCTVWGVIEIGALLGLLGCALGDNLVPAIMPAALAVALLLALRPDSTAVADLPDTKTYAPASDALSFTEPAPPASTA